jgi:hypothetical protein
MKLPPLVHQLGLHFKGATPLVRIALYIVLTREIAIIQREGGWSGGGGWWSEREAAKAGKRQRWVDKVRALAGISERLAAIYYKDGLTVISRLRTFPRAGTAEILALMERRPSTLTAEERQGMVESIVNLGLYPGDTMMGLYREYQSGQPKAPPVTDSPGGKRVPPAPWFAQDLQALALSYGVSPENAAEVARIVSTDPEPLNLSAIRRIGKRISEERALAELKRFWIDMNADPNGETPKSFQS